MKCAICDTESPGFAWTDTHGVAQCLQCGTPYTIYHYEDGRRVDKEPELLVRADCIELLRRYWAENKPSRIPGGHSFQGGYELANADEHNRFCEWMDAHAPKAAEVAAS